MSILMEKESKNLLPCPFCGSKALGGDMGKTTKQESIEHHKRLLKFAETQPKEDMPDYCLMLDSIKENWGGKYCSYCKKYSDCPDCPLCVCGVDEEENCCNGLWEEIDTSETWEEWIMWEKRVIEYIRQNG